MDSARQPTSSLPRVGLMVFSGGSGPARFERAGRLAVTAEETGFAHVWTGELYDRSATIMLAALAQATTACGIGSCIAYGVGRTPVTWAAEARDLDELSGGRLILGLGNGNTRMMEDWHGVDGTSPALRIEELVPLLHRLWHLDEGPVSHEGRFYRVHLAPPLAPPPPFRPRIPILAAGVNPRMIRAAASHADGLIGHPMFTSRYIAEVVRPALEDGAARRDAPPATDVPLVRMLICSVDDDVAAARRRLAFAISQYAASRVYDRLFALHGWTEHQHGIRAAARAGDAERLVAAVPDEVVDAIGIACRVDELGDRVAAHVDGDDDVVLSAPAWGLEPEVLEQLSHRLVEGMAGVLR